MLNIHWCSSQTCANSVGLFILPSDPGRLARFSRRRMTLSFSLSYSKRSPGTIPRLPVTGFRSFFPNTLFSHKDTKYLLGLQVVSVANLVEARDVMSIMSNHKVTSQIHKEGALPRSVLSPTKSDQILAFILSRRRGIGYFSGSTYQIFGLFPWNIRGSVFICHDYHFGHRDGAPPFSRRRRLSTTLNALSSTASFFNPVSFDFLKVR